MHFVSDNCAPVHPRVMDALMRANQGYATSYGDDAIMDRVRARLREVFEAPEAAIYLVGTGGAANALALATYVQPWQAIYCHCRAHMETDECGGLAFYSGGATLVLIDGSQGKLAPEALASAISASPQCDVHAVQRGAVSITNASEAGTVYSCAEVAAISAIAKRDKLPLHMDGARFANALVSLGCTPAELTWKSGVDVLSFGGTKNGLMGVEAVVMFDPAHAWEFELRRKRGGHLFSKHRYLSAQMEAYLGDDLWLNTARTANAMAARLSAGLAAISGASLVYPTQANMVFVRISRARHRRAKQDGATYFLMPTNTAPEGADDEVLAARLVCSWSTTKEDVDEFLNLVRS
ncbi:MAG: threonine aldolase family protein [Paracoccaceae bacterium]